MLAIFRPALVLLVLFTALTGVIYPLAMTGVIQLISPFQANGSLITHNGQVVGSQLISQRFTGDGYFHARPSAAGQDGFDAAASSGSNLGPLSVKLIERVKDSIAGLTKAGATTIPADAVTASASGLDPHISPAFAALQIARIAASRGVPQARISDIVTSQTDLPLLGIIGEPRINVLLLNLALDEALKPRAG